MLLSENVAIATPVKNGTRSLEAASRKHGDFYLHRPRHGVLPWPGWEGQHVVMMVREPHARLVSMWSHLKRHEADKHIQPIVKDMTFTQFIYWLANWRERSFQEMKNPIAHGTDMNQSPWRWVMTLHEMESLALDSGYVVHPWKTEELDGLPGMLAHQFSAMLAPVGRVNASDAELGEPMNRPPAASLFSPRTERLAGPWLRDGDWFGYP